jgi:hypothetical protein
MAPSPRGEKSKCKSNGRLKCITPAMARIRLSPPTPEVELKIKQNREMVSIVKPPTAPLIEDLRMLDELKKSGLKIERP